MVNDHGSGGRVQGRVVGFSFSQVQQSAVSSQGRV